MLSIFFPSVGFWSYLCGDFVTLGVLLYVWDLLFVWVFAFPVWVFALPVWVLLYVQGFFLLYVWVLFYLCRYFFTCVGFYLPLWVFALPVWVL